MHFKSRIGIVHLYVTKEEDMSTFVCSYLLFIHVDDYFPVLASVGVHCPGQFVKHLVVFAVLLVIVAVSRYSIIVYVKSEKKITNFSLVMGRNYQF